MPFIANKDAPEIPWREGYRSFTLAGKAQGIRPVCSTSIIEPGRGAPLHFHENVDEVLIVIEGTLDFRLSDERRLVGPDSTVAIPAKVPHSFTVVGDKPARIYAFLPQHGGFAAATYLEGGPPAAAVNQR